MKIIVSLISILALSGCNGCWTPMPVVSCGVSYGGEWPPIARYQKPETIGHTDSEQRWKDAVACGATYGDNGILSAIIDKNLGVITDELIFKFDSCMAERGYQEFTPEECGTQDPDEDTGKCNL